MLMLIAWSCCQAEVCEDIVRNCGIDFTLIRSSWFAQNFSEGYLHGPVLQCAIILPAGQVQESNIDVDDIAEVAVAALTQTGHSGQLYEVAIRLTSHPGRQPSHLPLQNGIKCKTATKRPPFVCVERKIGRLSLLIVLFILITATSGQVEEAIRICNGLFF